MTSFDQRSEERTQVSKPINYTLNSEQRNAFNDGIIENISKGGMCIFTPLELKEDQEIYIKNPTGLPFQTAKVRWIEQYDHEYYKVGLEFVP